nr:transcription initiation protein [uncultured Duganella sp.]
MTKFLISFPASAMKVPDADMLAVSEASHRVIREAKAAGVYVFAGGINSGAAPTMVAADGHCTSERYRETMELDGGFCVLELPSRADAVDWAARLASACRCAQELREFYQDPES